MRDVNVVFQNALMFALIGYIIIRQFLFFKTYPSDGIYLH